MHRHGTMKKRLSTHSNGPCLLERRMSEDPHFKQTKSFSFMAASIRTLLPAMVRRHHRRSRKAPRGSDLWGRKERAKAVYDLDIPSRRSIIYLEMMNFLLMFQHKIPFQTRKNRNCARVGSCPPRFSWIVL